MTAHVETEIRNFLSRHAGEAVRPVPLAQKMGLKDIRVVRAALAHLARCGELVSCDVIKDGVHDKEYRLAAGRASDALRGRPYTASVAPRRADASAIPSRMTDLPKAERSIRVKPEVTYADDPTREVAAKPLAAKHERASDKPDNTGTRCGICNRAWPTLELALACLRGHAPAEAAAAPSSPQPAAAAAVPAAANTSTESARTAGHSGLWHGRDATRQDAVREYIQATGRPVTTSELLDHFHSSEPLLVIQTVSLVVSKMVTKGRLARCGKRPEPRRGGLVLETYATPEIAAAQEEPMPASAHVGLAAALAPFTNRIAADAEPETATLVAAPAPAEPPRIDARARLEACMLGAGSSAYSLAYLVRVAGNAPEALHALAGWLREGRVVYGEMDTTTPMVRPVEGRW